MVELYNNVYKNKKVLITGHTGFKGSWLTLWLKKLNANVYGYSLDDPSNPSHYKLLNLSISETIADVRDFYKLNETIKSFKPDIIFHLAAQPLVRKSFKDSKETFETNLMGTINLFESIKNTPVKAVINVTTDKCYFNIEKEYKYKEDDKLGGKDPYSASKACSELITTSYKNSFFNPDDFQIKHNTLIATVRAGNVIGGGDWGEDRLFTDIINSISKNREIILRYPYATRPWQHIFDALHGYLLLGERLLTKEQSFASSFNIGPSVEYSVQDVFTKAQDFWGKIDYKIDEEIAFKESMKLQLDTSKAQEMLNHKVIFSFDESIKETVLWYKNFYENNELISEEQLSKYFERIIDENKKN